MRRCECAPAPTPYLSPLYHQAIGGKMGRVKAQGLLKVSAQIREGLSWTRVDQVDIEILEPCLQDGPQRFARFVSGVKAAQEAQQMGLKRLRAQAQPIDAAGTIAEKMFGVRRVGIRLQADLDA